MTDGSVVQLVRIPVDSRPSRARSRYLQATHLFQEPGALPEVGRLAANWFTRYLSPQARP
jgi:hypothetical protein